MRSQTSRTRTEISISAAENAVAVKVSTMVARACCQGSFAYANAVPEPAALIRENPKKTFNTLPRASAMCAMTSRMVGLRYRVGGFIEVAFPLITCQFGVKVFARQVVPSV